MGTFVTKAEVVDHLSNLNEDITTSDISDIMLNGSCAAIEDRIGFTYDSGEKTLNLNGNGEKHIFVPDPPINSLTSITVYASDETTTELDLSGSDRDIWWDEESGRIEFVDIDTSLALFLDADDLYGYKFTNGLNNIKIVGSFGQDAPSNVKLLQIMLILKQLTLLDPNNYRVDLMMEKIGGYQYRYGSPSGQSPKNQYKTLDGFIESLFESIEHVPDVQAI